MYGRRLSGGGRGGGARGAGGRIPYGLMRPSSVRAGGWWWVCVKGLGGGGGGSVCVCVCVCGGEMGEGEGHMGGARGTGRGAPCVQSL